MAQIFSQVKLATTENVNIDLQYQLGTSSIDGVIVNEGDRVLVKAQSSRIENGIYNFNSSGILVRASDFLEGSYQSPATVVFIEQGNTFADTGWVLSTDGTILVGSTDIIFERFSTNQKPSNTSVTTSIILRSEKGYPLTNTELDNNFKYLSTELDTKLYSADFTPENIVDRINSLSAEDANINAYKVQGLVPDDSPNVLTIAKRDSVGNLYANNYYGNLIGNAETATNADYSTLAGNVDGVVALEHGGTNATNAEDSRSNLEAVWIGGDTLTGKLVLDAVANENKAPIRLIPGVPNEKQDGDIWASDEQLFYRLNSTNKTIATLESPTFSGFVSVPTVDNASDGNAAASTAFVKNIKEVIDADIALKAPIASPEFTGTPLSTTPATSDNSTKIATTAYTVAKIDDVIANYYTKLDTDAQIDAAKLLYYTKEETDTRISDELLTYYTKTQIDNTLSSYSTTTQMNSAISNAISSKANTTYVDGLQDKWGTSRKFVQTAEPTNPQDGDIWFKI